MDRTGASICVSTAIPSVTSCAMISARLQNKRGGGRHLFTMIHASDHNEAPNLMQRAYRSVMLPLEPKEQLNLKLDNLVS